MRPAQLANLFVLAIITASCGASSNGSDGSGAETTIDDSGKKWVSSERLDRRTCPSKSCGVVGRLFFREAATPLETKGDWIRVTKYYDASCEAGKSKYVDEGRADCSAANGIVDGKFAEWVLASGLSDNRPSDPADTATVDEAIIAQSDDFGKYRKQFVRITAKLIDEGRCTKAEFEEMGGWLKSVTEHRNEPVYFMYCGGMTASNKIYVNAATEQILP